MRAHRSKGGALPALIIVVGLLVALGGWNYLRNLRAEQQDFRPYRSYTDAQLEQLVTAYEAEVESLRKRYESARRRSAGAGGGALLDERVAAFERTRRHGEQVRALGAELSEREAALRDFQTERQLRAAERQRLRTFLRRLLTIRL